MLLYDLNMEPQPNERENKKLLNKFHFAKLMMKIFPDFPKSRLVVRHFPHVKEYLMRRKINKLIHYTHTFTSY